MSVRRPDNRSAQRGFTLIEVMVALAIVALGMSALLEALSVSAGNVAALRDKTIAEWVAMNKIADARLTLNVPTLGSSEGDIDDCAHGTWHWRQEIDTVAAIPGLVSITVSVRRTGNAAPKPSGSRSSVNRGLGATAALGPTAPLGSVTTFGAGGCIAAADPGSSLGSSSLGLGAPPALGAPATLGSSSQLGQQSQTVGSLGVAGTASSSVTSTNAGPGPSSAFGSLLGSGGPGSPGNGTQSSNSSSNSASSASGSGSAGGASGPSWLVTLTGFRGNSLGAANGETPNWTSSSFPGEAGANGTPNNNGATNGPGSTGGLSLGTNTPPGTPQSGTPALPTPPGATPGLP